MLVNTVFLPILLGAVLSVKVYEDKVSNEDTWCQPLSVCRHAAHILQDTKSTVNMIFS